MLKTVLSRYNYMIEERKKNIRHMKDILQGKDNRYSYDLIAIKSRLKAEKYALKDLLTNSIYQKCINREHKQILEQYCS